MKPALRRAEARRDIEAASDYYEDRAGREVASRFLEAVRKSFGILGSRPRSGSPRPGHDFKIAGLRNHKVGRFPFLIFYVKHEDCIEVWRILHARSDLREHFAEGDEEDPE